jgi:UDP-N-acetylglucosamine enolpyruvyl transferase
MEKFHIEGGIPLKGEMTPSGNKNARLAHPGGHAHDG